MFSILSAWTKMAKKNALSIINRDDDGEDDDEKELGLDENNVVEDIAEDIAEKVIEVAEKGLVLTEKVAGKAAEKATEILTDTSSALGRHPQAKGVTSFKTKTNVATFDTTNQSSSVPPDQLWKRVSDPRGLPEQDASVYVKSRLTLKEEIIHNKNLLHKYTNRMFDDRMFIVNNKDPGHTAGEEVLLNNAIGTNKHNNPMVTKMAEVRMTYELYIYVVLLANSFIHLLLSYFSTLHRRSKVSKSGCHCGGQVSISSLGAIHFSHSSSYADASVFCAS